MIQLRNAQLADYTTIAALHAESWRQNYRGLMSDDFLNNEAEQDRLKVWQERLQSPAANQQVTVATLDGQIVGFSCVYLHDDPVFGSYLDNLHVTTRMQNSGIGVLLIKECAKFICSKGSDKRMYLWVFELNEKARRFYERLGGVHVETVEKKNFDGQYAQVCRYAWNDASILL